MINKKSSDLVKIEEENQFEIQVLKLLRFCFFAKAVNRDPVTILSNGIKISY